MEHGEPLGEPDGRPPAALVDLVQAWVRDRDLHPVATLSTRRTVHLLLGAPAQVLAEAADDVVTARGQRAAVTAARRSATGGNGRSNWSTGRPS